MARISPNTKYGSKKLTIHLLEGKRWWQLGSIDTALERTILKEGRNHATSVQPLVVDDILTYGITKSGSDDLCLVTPNRMPDITPSQKYSEKLPLLLRKALTYADRLVENYKGQIEEQILPSVAYERQYHYNPY